MRRLGWLFALTLVFGTTACGDDDGPAGTVDSGTSGDSGMAGTDSGMTGADSGMTGTDSGMTSTDAGPMPDVGMMPDTGMMASADAEAFCDDFEDTCDYGGATFADRDACLAFYDDAAIACETCITTHLGLAGDDPDTHCPHVAGNGPCDAACM